MITLLKTFMGLMKKPKKPRARFFSLIPGAHTLYPVIRSEELDRDWIKQEKEDYRERQTKCPMANIINAIPFNQPHSIGKCPAINSVMRTGYVVRAPADFKVHTNGDGHTILFTTTAFSPPGSDYVVLHDSDTAKWLMDSSKDNVIDQVIKVNTCWRVQADDDIVFLQTKVPFVNESRFSAITGILDPRSAYEVNVQLWWHVKEGDETIKAGTPLACYVPISRKLLEDLSVDIDIATPEDYVLENEFQFTAYNEFPDSVNVTRRQLKTNKILRKYWK